MTTCISYYINGVCKITNNVMFLKLITGENIVSFVEMNDEYLILKEPLQIFVQNTSRGSLVRLSQWIPFVEEKTHIIKRNSVLLITNPEEEMCKYYLETISIVFHQRVDIENNKINQDEDIEQAMYEKTSNTNIRIH